MGLWVCRTCAQVELVNESSETQRNSSVWSLVKVLGPQ